MRFAIREARLADVDAICRAHAASWQDSYRGILPGDVIDRADVGHRAMSRRRLLADPELLTLVAYDTTHGDIVGLCDAGPARRPGRWAGEIYALYLVAHAKRYGLGSDLFDATCRWLRASNTRSLVIWVLDNNPHAHRFYEAMGGRVAARIQSAIAGFPIVERAYVWDAI
jgi:GNAT superfamily N-acetyltransferase|nr:GNAT family N-acetyltransferase [Kofleriaceae bacterium]